MWTSVNYVGLGAAYIHLRQVSDHVFLNPVKTKSLYKSRYD